MTFVWSGGPIFLLLLTIRVPEHKIMYDGPCSSFNYEPYYMVRSESFGQIFYNRLCAVERAKFILVSSIEYTKRFNSSTSSSLMKAGDTMVM